MGEHMYKQDVFSYGVISTSRLIMIEGTFPKADHYAEMQRQYRMTGGEAANSSIALSRLGVKVKLDGNWLGNNSDELQTIDLLSKYDIDITRVNLKEGFTGPNEVVIADSNTRTIFGNYGKSFGSGCNWNEAFEDDIQNSKVVCLDPFFKKASEQVASYCLKHKRPYVTVDCPYDSFLAQNAEVVIIAGEYRSHTYRGKKSEELFRLYQNHCKGLVIFTFGSDHIIYGRKDGGRHKAEPYSITAVDTAGAGDSFRSGVVFGLLNGGTDEEIIRYGSAVSALVCMRFPGVMNAPGLDEVERFMLEKAPE